MRALKATASAGNGIIALFLAFGAICLFGWLVLILVAIAVPVIVVVVVLAAIAGKQDTRRACDAQADIDRLATQRPQSYYSNRR